MEQQVNKVYEPLFKERPRYFILMGGRGAGRSTVASQFANAMLAATKYFRCAIMRYVLGDIRNSIYREITDRAKENGIWDSLSVNDSLMTLRYGRNSINAVGFKKSSGDQKAKLKSLANYTCVIVEEADEIPEEDFMQLDDSLRTLKGDITIILLLNAPPKGHWILNRWFDLEPSEEPEFYIPKLKAGITDTIFIGTSYEDNRVNLSADTIHNYEAYQFSKPYHYWNMIKGYVPEVARGKIYSNWKEIDAVPHEARLERYWIDFGYTNDPTSIGAVYYFNGGYILHELAYQYEMSNREIADLIKNQPKKALIVADSAEPKSIAELQRYGLTVIPAEKGPDSILYGIQVVKDQQISITKSSVSTLKELNNYSWKIDKATGTVLQEPEDKYNHSMDGIRYALCSLAPVLQRKEFVEHMPRYARSKPKPNPAR